MKNLKLIALALTLLISTSTFADTKVTLSDIELTSAHLQVQKVKLLETIATYTASEVVLEHQINVIKDYSKRDLSTFLAKYPVSLDAAFTTAVYTSAKLMQSKLINPALAKAEGGLIVRLLQRFPKMSKTSAYVIATVAAGAEIYYTVDRVRAYADLTTKTKEQIDALLDQKFADYYAAKDLVAVATTQLLQVNAALNEMTESTMEKTYSNVR